LKALLIQGAAAKQLGQQHHTAAEEIQPPVGSAYAEHNFKFNQPPFVPKGGGCCL
jgi:hypothetical protein